MELDDLRRRWQQSAPPESTLDDNTLRQLLARRSGSPVAKMRRNVWLEIGFGGLCLVVAVAGLLHTRGAGARAWPAWLLVICLGMLPYYMYKMRVLNRLHDTSGSLRGNVRQQLSNLRDLVRLYYRITMWSVPVSTLVGIFSVGSLISQGLSGKKLWIGMAILVGFYALYGLIGYFLARWFTRWYLQKLYGQHLDRLEALLKELEE